MADGIKVQDAQLDGVSGGFGTQYNYRYYVVRGDTLERIAHRYNTTVDLIMKLNPTVNREDLRAGTVLIICVNG